MMSDSHRKASSGLASRCEGFATRVASHTERRRPLFSQPGLRFSKLVSVCSRGAGPMAGGVGCRVLRLLPRVACS